MARAIREDLLQQHNFWLLDIDPSPAPPFFILGGPKYAFSSVSAPSITSNLHEIRQLNSVWPDYTPDSVEVGSITLSRGVSFGDGTFYRWIRHSILGTDIGRRNLLLIQYMSGFAKTIADAVFPIPDVMQHKKSPARAWLLWGCRPTGYRPSQDFDATGADVSIAELEVQPRAVEEFSLKLGLWG